MRSRREQGRPQLLSSGLLRRPQRSRSKASKQRAEEVDADADEDYVVVGSATTTRIDETQGSRDGMLKIK